MRKVASGTFASTVIGFTDVDEHGLEGLEYQYDKLLRGASGSVELEEDQFGRSLPFAEPRVVEQAHPGYCLRSDDRLVLAICRSATRCTKRSLPTTPAAAP